MLITLNSIIPFVVVNMNVTFCFVCTYVCCSHANLASFRVLREVVVAIQQSVKYTKNIELKLLSVYNKKIIIIIPHNGIVETNLWYYGTLMTTHCPFQPLLCS